MEGVPEIFGDAVCTYESDLELLQEVNLILEEGGELFRKEIIDRIRTEYAFERRAPEIPKVVQDNQEYL